MELLYLLLKAQKITIILILYGYFLSVMTEKSAYLSSWTC